MIIAKQYELSDALLESNFQSFHARHLVTGRQVLVHLLTNLSLPARSLSDIIAGLNVERQAQLLDAGEHDGISYLVTVPIPGFTTLQSWLGQGEADGPRVSPALRANDPGEFTRFFRPPPEAPLPRSFDASPPQAAPAPPDPGEFTRLFSPAAASSSRPAGQPSDATQLSASHFPPSSRLERRSAQAPPPTFFHSSPTPPPASAQSYSPGVPKRGMAPVWVGVVSAALTCAVLAIIYLLVRG